MIKSKSFQRYQFIISLVLDIMVLIMIIPLILLFMSSITSEKVLLAHGYSFFPKEFSLEAYRYIWTNKETIFHAYFITIFATLIGTVVSIILSSMMAFSLSIHKLPFRRILNFYVVFTMLFSGGLVPSYLMWTGTFHIKNSIFALIIPNLLLNAMNVMLIRSYCMNNIPTAIYEAAQIDGASYFSIYRMIALPLGKPIIVTILLFTGLNYWNDWLNGLYYVTDSKFFSIQVLLNKMMQDIQALRSSAVAGTAIINIPASSIRMAIAFVALVPILLVYPFIGKYFEKGIALGAVKG